MTVRYSRSCIFAALSAAFALVAPQAGAKTYAALSNPRTLTIIDSDPGRVVRRLTVTGVNAGLVGIDVRPVNSTLYGIYDNGIIATINTTTGLAVIASNIGRTLTDDRYSVDFNPVADRLRVIGSSGENLRIDVTTGAVTTDMPIAGPMPNPFTDPDVQVGGAAYTNSKPGPAPRTTLLYDIDRAPSALYLQIPPNDGRLVPVGRLIMAIGTFGFDIFVDVDNRNRGSIVASNELHEIDLAGGRIVGSTPIAGLDATVRDLAALPD